MSEPISSVLLVFAMEQEATPLIAKLGLTRDEPSRCIPFIMESSSWNPYAHMVNLTPM